MQHTWTKVSGLVPNSRGGEARGVPWKFIWRTGFVPHAYQPTDRPPLPPSPPPPLPPLIIQKSPFASHEHPASQPPKSQPPPSLQKRNQAVPETHHPTLPRLPATRCAASWHHLLYALPLSERSNAVSCSHDNNSGNWVSRGGGGGGG